MQGGAVRLVAHGRVAAVISETDPDEVLGTPADLLAHTQLLDALAAAGPVLPLAFGTIIPGADAVEAEVLEPNEDAYAAGLESVAGRTQFTVTVTFSRDDELRAIVEEVPAAAELQAAIAGTTEDETRPQRIQLGELMVRALEERQPEAAEPVIDRLEEVTSDLMIHDRRQPDDVVEAAVLVEYGQLEDFEQAVEDLAREHHPGSGSAWWGRRLL
ncbi:GvpL/GvpF family gas vesicle protein [Nesterenkonia pannonica]|uniref:GvpL/GvpF family gas vesicle protein n=1 Tax=Nesterenkonia pannonica TaxID=1548602 RepID=UPI0021647154|nr:GvpL/GvpF family gas vesicle protein [Nesterenkonia pannonica]